MLFRSRSAVGFGFGLLHHRERGVGGGVADRIRELGFNCIDVNVSETVALNQQANRLRDELWLNCKEWLETRAVKSRRTMT